MDNKSIIDHLGKNGLSDMEILSEEQDCTALKFYYDFDSDELKAAEAYANDQNGAEKNEDWYEDSYLPYLTELAVDNVGEIIEEIMDEGELKAQFVSYQMEEGNDYSEFISIFYKADKQLNIEDVLEKLDV